MILTFRPIKIRPPEWKSAYERRPSAPFGATYGKTMIDLDREITHLHGDDPTLQLDLTDADLRLDGQIRAGARPEHPGVILSFDTKNHGTLTYGTDRFDHWHGNLRAIALGLDCLRRVERYGIAERGQQYAGYREIGTGIALGPAEMTREQAARILVDTAEVPWPWEELLADADLATTTYRAAARLHHPDNGGDPAVFRTITTARDVLVGEAR